MVSPAEPKPRFSLEVRKWDVVDVLRREHGLQSIVLIITPSTGPDMHGRPELIHFTAATTLTYASDEQRAELDHVRSLPGLDAVAEWCRENKPVADIVFIDCWHSYEDSIRSLDLALEMLPNGGFIVMHDCDPPDLETAGPPTESVTMLWCGQSWRAFVDFTASLREGAEWFVVESDLGIGVIRVPPARRKWRTTQSRKQRAPAGDEAGWNWLVEHRREVLHPMSIAEWQQRANGVSATSNHYNL